MQADCEIQNQAMQQEDTEHLNDLKITSSFSCKIENQSRMINQIDREFQKLLLQLSQSKIQENSLFEVRVLIEKLSASLLLQVTNGPQILYTLYQILQARESTIKRNFPFCPISSIISRIRRLINRIKKQLLKNLGFKCSNYLNIPKALKSSFHPYVREESIENRLFDLSSTELQHSTISLKKTKPIVFIQEPLLI